MPAVVRVKRRIDEEPLGAFVLNGKKRRLDGEIAEATTSGMAAAASFGATSANKDEISTILKFAGTIQSQDDSAISQLARLTKEEAKQLVQQKSRKPTNHTERARQEMRQSLHENRFRVVNCLRTTLDAVDEEEGEAAATGNANAKEITIVDIEKHAVAENDSNMCSAPTSSSQTAAASAVIVDVDPSQPSDSDTGYVYDLYLPENEQQAAYVDLMDDNYLSVHALDDLVYEDRYNNDEDEDYDSEDSNQENYAGNEYPDEDDDEMNGGDDDDEIGGETEDVRNMRHAVEKFVFGDNDEEEDDEYYDQSSDDEDCIAYSDPYVHSVNVDEDDRFVDDVDFCDVDRYGMAYARYKARILKRLNGDGGNDDDDDDSDKNEDSAEERYHSASEN